jgi:hypothetical protein
MLMTEHRRPWRIRSFARVRAAAAALQEVLLRIKGDLAVWSDVRSFPALAILAGVDCVAVLILLRERAGSPPLRLSDSRLCSAALAAAALTVGSRWFLARIEREKPAVWIRSLLAALSVLPLVALLTTATPRNSPWAISLVSALAVLAGNVNLLWSRRPAAHPEMAPANSPPVVISPLKVASPSIEIIEPATGASLSGRVRASDGTLLADEWIERTTDPVTGVACRGQIVAWFAAGQSVAFVHIPFVPAFGRVPEFSCEVVGDPSIRSRSPAVYRYGARVELKRNGELANAIRAEIRFEARAAPQSSRAA